MWAFLRKSQSPHSPHMLFLHSYNNMRYSSKVSTGNERFSLFVNGSGIIDNLPWLKKAIFESGRYFCRMCSLYKYLCSMIYYFNSPVIVKEIRPCLQAGNAIGKRWCVWNVCRICGVIQRGFMPVVCVTLRHGIPVFNRTFLAHRWEQVL